MNVADLIADVGQTPSATARVTGLSRMTVQRVRDGVSSPSLHTLRELALAAGYDVDLQLVPASDPGAAIAARLLIDPGYETSGDPEPNITAWVQRLERHNIADPRQLLALAGTYAAPQHRNGARYFAPKPGLEQQHFIHIAGSASEYAEGTSALSGAAAARAYTNRREVSGPVVIWAQNTAAVAERLRETFTESVKYQPAGVLLAPTLDEYFVDSLGAPVFDFTTVSPMQAVIDLYGLGYADLADDVTAGW